MITKQIEKDLNDLQKEKFLFRVCMQALQPDPLHLTVSQWADVNRVLSTKSSSEPGKWRTDRTPYLREIMDCLSSNNPIQQVVFMKGAQVGATEMGNN